MLSKIIVCSLTSLRKAVYLVCFSRPDLIMIVWKLALSIAHSLQLVAALIVAVLEKKELVIIKFHLIS